MADSIVWPILRYLYAAYYLYFGIYIALFLTHIVPPPHLGVSAASASIQAAMSKTGFVFPALALTCVASACALCFYRTAPLGLVMLAPVMVIIFLTDTLLDTAWLWAALHAPMLAALAWHFRTAYRPLWNYPTMTND